ncbi:MAG: hypothetical protein ABSA44_09715 [Bacteroidota bacterium]|jgi:hypothetical protein
MPKNKSIRLPVSPSTHLPICKFCGCSDPLGYLPEHLSAAEMRIIVTRLHVIAKEISPKIFASPSSIAQVLSGHLDSGSTFDKLEKYLLSLIKQSNQCTAPAQSETVKNSHASI